MAWKKGQWQSVEHFSRVQRSWSRWALSFTLGVFLLGVVAAIIIPAYQGYVMRARAHQTVSVERAVQPAVAHIGLSVLPPCAAWNGHDAIRGLTSLHCYS